MPKEFYTEKDIEDLVRRGVLSLQLGENVVLTELAYEKANRLGMQLLTNQPDTPPTAPVRPYLAEKSPQASLPPASPTPPPAAAPNLHQKVRAAVLARLGGQIDPKLLDVIIQRVLANTGVK